MLRVLEAGNGFQEVNLDIEGEARGKSVHIPLIRVPAFGFQKELVGGLFGKTDNLVLDGWAVAGTVPSISPA
jgi:hypothetical protein